MIKKVRLPQVWTIRSSPRCQRRTSRAAGRWLASTTLTWGPAVRSSTSARHWVRGWHRGSASSVLTVTSITSDQYYLSISYLDIEILVFTVPRHNVPPAAEDLPLVVLRGLRLLRAVLQAGPRPRPLARTLSFSRVCGPEQLQPEEKLPGTAQAVQPPDRQGGEGTTLTTSEAEQG